MRVKPIVAAAAAVVALTLTACGTNESTSHPNMSSAAAMSPQAATMAMRTGQFGGLNGKHVAGVATIDGSQLMLTNFSSDEGPDLHIYLTNGTTESDVASGKHLGSIKYNVAAQTFSLSGVNTAMYDMVVIHCDKAKAVFGTAALR